MTRVLLVHEPPDGGVAEHVRLIAGRLGAHGFDVEVAGPPGSIVAERIRADGIVHHELPFVRSYRNPLDEPKVTLALVKLIRSRRIDLVHAHSSKAGVHGRVAALLARRPAVYTPHCFGFMGPVSSKRKLAATAIERAMAPLSHSILCVCASERDAALRQRVAGPQRLRLVLQGIPAPDRTVPVAPAIAALHRRGPLVGAINALRAQKRTDVFLDAIPLVWAQDPDVQFVLAGSGELEPELKRQAARLGLDADERFAFLPFRAPSEQYLNGLDLYVLPSAWEALPIALLEAMGAGVPQIASDVDGNREAVSGDTGRLIPPGDPRALAAAVLELVAHPGERDRLVTGSRRRQATHFTIERMVSEIAAVYNSAVSR